MAKRQWAYAKLPANGNERMFVAQGGNNKMFIGLTSKIVEIYFIDPKTIIG